ncbi:MAG: guanylate kinase [Trueperaceae bacterium]
MTTARHGQGILFVMTGASGVGKDTIRRAAMPRMTNLEYSISATTRPRRQGEEDGVQYWFLQRPTFERMIRDDELLEHADYVGDYYGTPAQPVRQALARGTDVLLELELVGARQVKKRMPDAVMMFIAPPSLRELERRLRGRGTDSEEKIQKRLTRAREEIRAVREFDYVIVNDHLERAVALFECVIRAERGRARALTDEQIAEFLDEREGA